MQDCTNFQSEDLGVGLEYHKKKQLMWVLNSWQIVIEKYPAMGEEITVGTQAYGFEKMFGYRNFLITDSSGECVAKANSPTSLYRTLLSNVYIVPPDFILLHPTIASKICSNSAFIFFQPLLFYMFNSLTQYRKYMFICKCTI